MKKGFSLIELLIGIVILLIALMAFFTVNQATSSKSMKFYYKFMAYSLAQETLTYCRGMGYKWADAYMSANRDDPFPLSSGGDTGWHNVVHNPIFSRNIDGQKIDLNDSYFSECNLFERKVELKRITHDGTNGIRVIVQLRMKGPKAKKFFTSEALSFSTTIMERLP